MTEVERQKVDTVVNTPEQEVEGKLGLQKLGADGSHGKQWLELVLGLLAVAPGDKFLEPERE